MPDASGQRGECNAPMAIDEIGKRDEQPIPARVTIFS
jgi:hypothetical protein